MGQITVGLDRVTEPGRRLPRPFGKSALRGRTIEAVVDLHRLKSGRVPFEPSACRQCFRIKPPAPISINPSRSPDPDPTRHVVASGASRTERAISATIKVPPEDPASVSTSGETRCG